MRIQGALVVLLIVVLATASPITGQDDPLPSVTPRGTVTGEIAFIALASYPIHDPIHQPVERLSLREAARANDYATFDALYREALQRGEQVGQYATLHELWTWAINDPIGAFYGRELHDRLARAYPGYAQFIGEYRIVDDHGNSYWPTSETRAFLLDQVKQGSAPKVLVAEAAPVRTETPRATEGSAGVPAGRSGAVPRRRPVANDTKSAEPAAAIAAKATPPPARATARDAVGPAGEDASAPKDASVSQDASASVDASATVVAAPVAAPDAAPTVVAVPPAVKTEAPASGSNARGLLLLVVGVIGIGMLAIMLRAPREAALASIVTPVQPPVTPAVTSNEEKPKPAAVEPLKRADRQPDDSKPRASGSRG